MEQSVEAFWENFERETGEKVLAKTMSQRFASPKDRGDWGLLVLSATGLRFRKTPGENWFASLFRASSPSVPENNDGDLVIRFSSIVSISSPPKKFLDFLFGSPFRTLRIEFTQGEAREVVRFALDPKNAFFAKLKELAKLT